MSERPPNAEWDASSSELIFDALKAAHAEAKLQRSNYHEAARVLNAAAQQLIGQQIRITGPLALRHGVLLRPTDRECMVQDLPVTVTEAHADIHELSRHPDSTPSVFVHATVIDTNEAIAARLYAGAYGVTFEPFAASE